MTCVRLLFLAIVFSQILSVHLAAEVAPCSEVPGDVLEFAVDRLYWDAYWNRLKGAGLDPSTRVNINVLWADDVIGYCAKIVNRCGISLAPPQVGQIVASEYNDETAGGEIRWSNRRLTVGNGQPGLVTTVEVRHAKVCQYSAPLSKSSKPTAIQRRLIAAHAHELITFLRQQLAARQMKGQVTIPYFSDNDPVVYLLLERAGNSRSLFLATWSGATGWAFSSMEEYKGSDREVIATRVLEAEMVRVWSERVKWNR